MKILKLKKRILCFLLAFLSTFFSLSYCLIKPVPVHATSGVAAYELWQLFAGLLGSWGIANEHSMNMFSSPNASYQDYKGAQDFSIGQMNDFQRFINAHSHDTSVAEVRWKGFIYNLKHGQLDLSSDVGQLFSDWISKVSEKAHSAWNDYINTQSFDKSKYEGLVNSNGTITQEFVLKIFRSFFPHSTADDEQVLSSDYWRVMIGAQAVFFTKDSDNNLEIYNVLTDDKFVVCGRTHATYGINTTLGGLGGTSVPSLSDCVFYYSSLPVYSADDKEHKVDLREKYKSPDILAPAQEKQLPSVISKYGSNLPAPQNDDNNKDDDDKKPLAPVTPVPINYPWERLYPSDPVTITDPDGHGDPITIYKPSTQIDIKTYIKWSKKTYIDIKAQLDVITNTLNKLLKISMKKTTLKEETDTKIDPDFNNDLNLKDKFPFSLPWDLIVVFKIFNSSPEAPCFSIPYPTINTGGGGFGYSVSTSDLTLDFNNDTFNSVARVLRVLMFLLFAVGLILLFWVK